MKFMNQAKRFGAVALGTVVALPAFAAVPVEVQAAIDEAKTDIMTIGGAILVVMIAIAVFMWLRKVAK